MNSEGLLQSEKKRRIWLILSILTIAVLEVVFFSDVLFNATLIGETNDSRLNNLLVEHWFHAFCGKEKFSSVNIFYPMPETVAFTDMLLGFAIPYSILRALGMNMFLANKVVLMAFHVMGSYAMLYLLNRKFKIHSLWSLVGVVAFSYSSAYYVRIGHTQLMAISLIPVFVIFLYSFFQKFAERKKRIRYGFLTITSYVLIMYTSWYTAFFTALFMVTFGAVYTVVACANKNHVFKDVWEYLKKSYKEVIAYVGYGIIIVIPFFKLYLAVSRRFGKRTYEEITKQLPELIDFINTSTWNQWMGGFFEKINLNGRAETRGMFTWELQVGFSLFVIALLTLVSIYMRRKYLRQKYKCGESGTAYTDTGMMVKISLIYSVLISFILLVQSNGVSLWYLIYRFFPGGSAIRAAVRYNFFLTIPVAIIISTGGDYLCRKEDLKSGVKMALPLLAAIFIWWSNYNVLGIQADWTVEEEERQLSAVEAPPEECEAMYIVDSAPSDHTYYGHAYSWIDYQHFAWEICEKYRLKNLNGYSGQFPIGWSLQNADNADIHKYATDWIEGTNIPLKVYYYDMGTNTWHEYVPVQ